MGRRIGGAGGGSDKGTSAPAVVAVAAAAAVAFGALGGGIGGGIGLGTEAAGGEAAVAEVTDGSDAALSRDFGTKSKRAKSSAKRGKTDEAWGRMGLKRLKRRAAPEIKCLAASTGRIRAFLAKTPCRSLHRTVLLVGAGQTTIVVSIAWVAFNGKRQASAFERIEKIQGSGDIKPAASTLLGLADIKFTGLHYHSRISGYTVVIAETEPVSGRPSDEVLRTIAEIATYLPRP
jgi:hypothetical protein